MGQNDVSSDFIVKMTKCRPVVHMCAKGSVPHAGSALRLTSSGMLLGPPRGKRPDILNGPRIRRFLGDYD